MAVTVFWLRSPGHSRPPRAPREGTADCKAKPGAALPSTQSPSTDPSKFGPCFKQVTQAIALSLGLLRESVEAVRLTRFDAGLLELELKTRWASNDNQEGFSYDIVQMLSSAVDDFDRALSIL